MFVGYALNAIVTFVCYHLFFFLIVIDRLWPI
jgi:hypothetical protein